ncbi:TonB-dependent receptor [Olivibacter sp. SDN3]|uniref:SusC/RagA family TonB-linked outer membrane protein n=1 Tax=Olivibacter sp. SDN3 TaxID=2764720 RepID=UPI0016515D4C|nr:TonB-dependent receptor [Olivibacter sp. SDN3]QNL48213.1 TonB-dependent receptor [Olivibacter sp. SDN3]
MSATYRGNRPKERLLPLRTLLSLAISFTCYMWPNFTSAQQQEPTTLSGTIIDEQTGEKLPGATVNVIGTSLSTKSDENGSFILKLSQELPVTIRVQYIGYTALELVANQHQLTLALQPDAGQLDEVVVVGYGSQKRSSLTNSVASIDGTQLTQRPVSNIQQAMQGTMPGVTIQDRGGAPGRSTANIRVRGITTFNSNLASTDGFDLSKNEALVIVDGFEQRMTDINPDDIENITVLKDAASTAIYGSRATNGVVLITTKKAKESQVQVDYNGYYALQNAINRPKMMALEQYMNLQAVAYSNAGVAVPDRFTEESIQTWVNATDRYQYPLPNTWFQTMLHTAPHQNHHIAVSGGNDKTRNRLSVRYNSQDGIITNFDNKLAEAKFNSIYHVSKQLTFSGDVNYRYNQSTAPTVDPINNFFHGSLWAVPKYPDGTYGLSTQGNNPLMFAEQGGLSRRKDDLLSGYVKADIHILEGLDFSVQLAGRANFTNDKNFTNAYSNTDQNTNITKTVVNNSLLERRDNFKEYTINNLLTYERTFQDHYLKGLIGYSQIGNTRNYLTAYRERFHSNDINSIGQGADDGTKDNDGWDHEFGLRSYFGRINYALFNRYLLEVNGRYDGSSKFTGARQYSFFPSFSLGWRIADESFFENIRSTINDLKLRGSWGETGNQSVDLYSYYAALEAVGYPFGSTIAQGYRQQILANTDLGWESTTQLDIGIDALLLNSKLNLTIDYYRKVTNDILLNLDIPSTVGLIAPPQNAGSVENKGWEFSLGYNSNRGADRFNYSVSANFNINHNEVIDLKGTGPYINGSDIDPRYIIQTGLPVNTLWGYRTDGLFQSAEEIAAYGATYAANTQPGDVKYLDLNGDGLINSNDMEAIGNPFPIYTFGLNSSFSYKSFELNVLLQGAADVDTRLAGALAEMGNQEGFTHQVYANNYWTPEHPDARFPRPIKFDLRNVATSDRLVVDASYLRLKNVQLAYALPEQVAKKLHLQRARVYISGTNLLTFSKLNEWNLDPEVGSGRAVYYPQTSLYTLGINLTY